MLNQVILETKVIKNNGLKYSAKGTAYLALTFIFNTLQKSEKGWETKGNFINGVLYGKQAQNLSDKLIPGKSLIVRGKLEQKKWESSDGIKRNSYSLQVDDIHFNSQGKAKIQDV